jgi:dolichol kinase
MMNFLIALGLSVLFFVSFAGIELLKRRFGFSPEYTRRLAHMVSGCVVILEYLYLPPFWVLFLMIGGGVIFFIASQMNLLTSVNDVSRQTYGQYVLTLGYFCVYILSFSDQTVFIPSILVITFADPLAGLVGTIMKADKPTILGSIVFFLVTFGILCQFGGVLKPLEGLDVSIYAVCAYVITLAERWTPLGFDNLIVPVATALLLLNF